MPLQPETLVVQLANHALDALDDGPFTDGRPEGCYWPSVNALAHLFTPLLRQWGINPLERETAVEGLVAVGVPWPFGRFKCDFKHAPLPDDMRAEGVFEKVEYSGTVNLERLGHDQFFTIHLYHLCLDGFARVEEWENDCFHARVQRVSLVAIPGEDARLSWEHSHAFSRLKVVEPLSARYVKRRLSATVGQSQFLLRRLFGPLFSGVEDGLPHIEPQRAGGDSPTHGKAPVDLGRFHAAKTAAAAEHLKLQTSNSRPGPALPN